VTLNIKISFTMVMVCTHGAFIVEPLPKETINILLTKKCVSSNLK